MKSLPQIRSQVGLHLRSDLHFVRKAWHVGMGLLILGIYALSGMSQGLGAGILAALFVLFWSLETLRLRNSEFNQMALRVMGPFMREHEVGKMSGTPAYLAAGALVFTVFPEPIAVLSMLLLIFGDPAASIFGILFGSKSIRFSNGKSLIGTLGGILVCGLVSFIFVQSLGLTGISMLAVVATGAIAGGVAELLPLELDDNFTIPMVSGLALSVAFIFLGL